MYVSVWGQVTWDALLFIALGFSPNPSEDEQSGMLDLLRLTFKFLPCPNCSSHATIYYEDTNNKFDVSSGDALFASIVQFKNEVNRRTGKATMTVTEAKKALIDRYTGNDIQGLSLSDTRRIEDHGRITSLQNRLNSIKSAIDGDIDHSIDVFEEITNQTELKQQSSRCNTALIITTVVMTALIIVLVILLLVAYRNKVHLSPFERNV
jgi:hypothetical protein